MNIFQSVHVPVTVKIEEAVVQSVEQARLTIRKKWKTMDFTSVPIDDDIAILEPVVNTRRKEPVFKWAKSLVVRILSVVSLMELKLIGLDPCTRRFPQTCSSRQPASGKFSDCWKYRASKLDGPRRRAYAGDKYCVRGTYWSRSERESRGGRYRGRF